jgi:phosphohistidine phosphatase
MELFIMRHGQAEPFTANDASRQLVEKGRLDVAKIIQNSSLDLHKVKQIWVSPFIRAQQTARIAAEILGSTQLITQHFLTPDNDPLDVVRQLQLIDCDSLMLVSHQPLVSRLIGFCCGTPADHYAMDTASLACIDFDVPGMNSGYMRWQRHPVI